MIGTYFIHTKYKYIPLYSFGFVSFHVAFLFLLLFLSTSSPHLRFLCIVSSLFISFTVDTLRERTLELKNLGVTRPAGKSDFRANTYWGPDDLNEYWLNTRINGKKGISLARMQREKALSVLYFLQFKVSGE